MNSIKALKDMLSIIYPGFYEVRISTGDVLIFLRNPEGVQVIEDGAVCSDKTQLEAVENHVHLFGKIHAQEFDNVKRIGEAIANNLLTQLSACYTERKFIIYLSINIKDSVILRFHQKWDDEPEYYNVEDFNNKNQKVYAYKNF